MTTDYKELLTRCLKLFHFGVNTALFVSFWSAYRLSNQLVVPERYAFYVCILYVCLMYFFCRVYNAYLIGYSRDVDIVLSLSLANLFSISVVYGATLILYREYLSPLYFGILLLVQILFNIVWDIFSSRIYFKLHTPENTLIVYGSKYDLIRLSGISCFKKRFKANHYLENPKSCQEIIEALDTSTTVFLIGIDVSVQNDMAKYCIGNNIAGYFLPHVGDIIMMGGHHVQSFSVPLMSIQQTNKHPEAVILKRLFDIFLSLVAIMITSPIMLLTALAVHFQDGGPAIYRQVRLTKNGKEFYILKFRSMVTDAEKDGIARLSSGEKDDRVTSVGRFIRATRIDELPQLFNILVGDMSFVGPRPERPEITAYYSTNIPEFNLRLKVKAGLTGYAQIYGKYNTDPYDKLLMDLIYINKMSLLTDLQLMFATVRVIFTKESTTGINQGNVTAIVTEEECTKSDKVFSDKKGT